MSIFFALYMIVSASVFRVYIVSLMGAGAMALVSSSAFLYGGHYFASAMREYTKKGGNREKEKLGKIVRFTIRTSRKISVANGVFVVFAMSSAILGVFLTTENLTMSSAGFICLYHFGMMNSLTLSLFFVAQ